MNQYKDLDISSGDWQAKWAELLTVTTELMSMIEIVDMAKVPPDPAVHQTSDVR